MTTHNNSPLRATVAGVLDNGVILQLLLAPSEELQAEQRRVAAAVPGQVPFEHLHITLATSAGLDTLPPPPQMIHFEPIGECVTRPDKTSVFLRVMSESQIALEQYIALLEKNFGVTGLQNPDRVFHVSLTNLVGDPLESIAKVWEYDAVPVL